MSNISALNYRDPYDQSGTSPVHPIGSLTPMYGQQAATLSALNQNHFWMPTQTQTALAASNIDPQTAVRLGDQMANVAKQGVDAIKTVRDDPVLEQQPSKMMILNQYLNHAVGPLPIAQQHLVDVQKTIQAQGFGTGLPADGIFTPEWNAAFQQSYTKNIQDTLAGEHRPASKSTGGALKWLKNTLPKEAANAIIGYVTHLPQGVRDLAADLASGATGGVESMATISAAPIALASGADPNKYFAGAQQRIAQHSADVGAFVENKGQAAMGPLGGAGLHDQHLSAQQYAQQVEANPGGRVVADVSNFLNLVSIAGIGKSLATRGAATAATGAATSAASSGGEAAAQKTVPSIAAKARALLDPATPIDQAGLEAAGRQPQTVAKLTGRLVGTTAGRVTLGSGAGVAYGAYHGDTGAQLLRDGALGAGAGYLGSYAFDNLPILQRTGALIARAAGDNGVYYRARSLMALPYEYQAVRTAGQVLGKAGVAGLALHAEAGLSPGDATSFTQSIQDSHTLDPLDDAVKKKLTFTVAGQKIQPNIDWLAFALHPPTHGEGATSAWLSQHASELHDAEKESLGNTSFIAEIARATGKNWSDLETQAGGTANANLWADNKVKSMASAMYAQEQLHKYTQENGPIGSLDRIRFLENAASDARNDPVILGQQLNKFEASPGTLTNMIRNEIATRLGADAGIDPTGGQVDTYLKRDLGDYMQAVRIAREHLLPNQDMLIGPHRGITEADDAEQALRGAGGMSAPPKRMLSVATDHYLTNDVAQKDVADFRDRLAAAGMPGKPADEYDKVVHDINTYFHKEFFVDPTQIPEKDPEALLDRLDEYARHQGASAIPDSNASSRVTKAIDDLKALGYKPIYGTETGHILLDDPMVDLGEPDRLTKRIVGHLGMNIDRFKSSTIGQYRSTSVRLGLQDKINDGDITINSPFKDANWLTRYLRDNQPAPNAAQRAISAATATDSKVKSLASAIQDAADTQITNKQAEAMARQTLMNEARGQFQLRDWSQKDVIRALTKPVSEADPAGFDALKRAAAAGDETAKAMIESGEAEKIPLMSEQDAYRTYATIIKSSANVPGHMVGAEKIQDTFRALGSGGFLGERLPGNVGYRVGNVPNELLKLRNQFRFQLSPSFSFRRLLKTNLKLMLEGVDPTFAPLHDMKSAGTLDDDLETLNRIMPAMKNEEYDSGVRYLASNDVFGIYDHRNMEARAAGILSRQGMNDEEIRGTLTRALGYGSFSGEEGRTALERTANFAFFPFSFDKTVYRNFGAYLLDHPGQMLLLNNALSAYKAYDQDHELTKRLTTQMPILNEALRLNMFAHGVSFGEPGGINAPILNMFMPQSWATSSKSKNTLERFVPVLKDAQRIGSELADQKNIVFTGGSNVMRELHGDINMEHPIQSTGDRYSQSTAAGTYRRTLYDKYADVLDHNSGLDDSEKITVPDDPKEFGKFAGQPITKDLLGQITEAKYPGWSRKTGVDKAKDLQSDLKDYKLNVTGQYSDQIRSFIDTAAVAESAFNNDSYTSDEAAQYTDLIRQNAIWLSERDSGFYKAYNKYFRYYFGPLESQQYG